MQTDRARPELLLYRDTRGLDPVRYTFLESVVKGLAAGGGLLVPERLPSLPLDEIVGLSRLPYRSRAAHLYRRFGVDVPGERVDQLMRVAYGSNFDTEAVAWAVGERLKGAGPMLVVSTAHWAKFGADVYKALRGIPYAEALSPELSRLTGAQLLAEVQALAPHASSVPRSLAELDALPERFAEVVDAGRGGVEGAVRSWLGRPS